MSSNNVQFPTAPKVDRFTKGDLKPYKRAKAQLDAELMTNGTSDLPDLVFVAVDVERQTNRQALWWQFGIAKVNVSQALRSMANSSVPSQTRQTLEDSMRGILLVNKAVHWNYKDQVMERKGKGSTPATYAHGNRNRVELTEFKDWLYKFLELKGELEPKHRVILVTHAPDMENKFLDENKLKGTGTWTWAKDWFDTQYLDCAFRKDTRNGGLGDVADRVGVQEANLHNAGNDAWVTLRVFIRLLMIDCNKLYPEHSIVLDRPARVPREPEWPANETNPWDHAMAADNSAVMLSNGAADLSLAEAPIEDTVNFDTVTTPAAAVVAEPTSTSNAPANMIDQEFQTVTRRKPRYGGRKGNW